LKTLNQARVELMGAIIETFDLTKVYNEKIVAVNHINLEIKEGEIFGLLGPNGAGKTTTVRMLTTFTKPTSGTAQVAGYDIIKEAAKVRRVIGYSAQEAGVDLNATATENLALFGHYHHLSGQKLKARIKELLELLGLINVADRLVKTYSSGMRKRLEIATALIHKPRILFLDEPTLGLDVQTRANIWDYIRKLNKEGTTIILTTHYLEEADKLCDRVAIIDHGKIVALGTPNELKGKVRGDSVSLTFSVEDPEQFEVSISRAEQLLLSQPFVKKAKSTSNRLVVYVNNGDSAIPKILHLLQNEELNVESVTLSRPSLDDVFLLCTGRTMRDSG